MKVYLDDTRATPEGWIRTYTVEQTIDLLKTGEVIELSLDNDLGDGLREGWEIMKWIEEEVFVNGFKPPKRFKFHTDNIVRKNYMKEAARKILDFVQSRS